MEQPLHEIEQQRATVDYAHLIRTLTVWKDILNARLLAFLALLGALGVFGLCMYNPTSLRIWGASLYAVSVLWPLMYVVIRKG